MTTWVWLLLAVSWATSLALVACLVVAGRKIERLQAQIRKDVRP